MRKKQWIVYAKAPFAGPEQVLDDLGRYTHRVAISNHRLLSMDDGQVTFAYKDRSDNNRSRQMPLAADEFIRRFLLHVLPPRIVKIRYFGFLFHRDKRRNIALIREQMGSQAVMSEPTVEDAQQIMLRLMGIDIPCCPHCGKGQMRAMAQDPEMQPDPRSAIASSRILCWGCAGACGYHRWYTPEHRNDRNLAPGPTIHRLIYPNLAGRTI